MPRGRKGPPQDSIDSILLAISRRDDIDPDTLSHYFDRLDEEWTEGAREKVLHLLRSNDQAAYAAAVLIFSELATDFDLEGLEDFVTDPTVSDMAKLSLSPILKELGSEMADDGILEYLNDPASAMQQMQLRLLELVGQSEMGVESILKDVISMPQERRLAFIAWLGSSNDPRAANLLVPLLESQTVKVITATIEALEQLGSTVAAQAIPALNHLISSTSNRAIKQQARAVLGRLTMQSVPGVAEETTTQYQHLVPHEARVSYVDGSGAQLIMLSWQRPDGLLKGINVLCQDQWGIKDCYGIDEMDSERWDDLIDDLDVQGFGSFKVPFGHGRALVAEARALNKRTRHKLPIAYSIWRPLLESPGSSGESEQAVQTLQEAVPLDAETKEMAKRGGELYQIPEFISWMYEPVARIDTYIARYWSGYNVLEIVSSTKRSRGKKGKQREKERQALLETLLTEALGELIDEKWRELYEARLRKQAALFHFVGRKEEAALIGAVAAVLHPASNVPVQEQAFPRAMLRLSIEQGPLRMMVESLGSDSIGAAPIHLFDKN